MLSAGICGAAIEMLKWEENVEGNYFKSRALVKINLSMKLCMKMCLIMFHFNGEKRVEKELLNYARLAKTEERLLTS